LKTNHKKKNIGGNLCFIVDWQKHTTDSKAEFSKIPIRDYSNVLEQVNNSKERRF